MHLFIDDERVVAEQWDSFTQRGLYTAYFRDGERFCSIWNCPESHTMEIFDMVKEIVPSFRSVWRLADYLEPRRERAYWYSAKKRFRVEYCTRTQRMTVTRNLSGSSRPRWSDISQWRVGPDTMVAEVVHMAMKIIASYNKQIQEEDDS